jgi:iron complex transport system ATP-binding protein
MLRELAHREGRLVVFSTHDLAIARETADRMWLFMPAERLVQGAPEDLALGGMIREAFSRRGVSFSEDGSPAGRPSNRYPRVSVEVAGPAGTRSDWTRRAIRRAGFAESTPGHGSVEPDTVLHLRVTAFEDQWVIETEGEEPEYADSILELVGRLRRRTPGAK